MKIRIALFIIFAFVLKYTETHAQLPAQCVRGKVTDAESRQGIPGANVVVLNSSPLIGTVSDLNGDFRLPSVPVGRQTIVISFIGYKTITIPGIMVSSGKETVVNAGLEEEVLSAHEVEVKATCNKDKTVNTMAMISARSFTIDESRRYAGSFDDPMRAVSNFAGVAGSADANSNQIVIRGNSPKGLLWRLDGMDIPNPNHFAYVGNSGGAMTMFSSQVLSNSDFYTAAFPAEFGNSISGVFDMKFRTGNNSKREYAFQLGIQGIEASAEGPFMKNRGSTYLFNYRYSILSFLQYIDPAMKNKIPRYQDLSFKCSFPTKKAGTFTLSGIGGISRSKFDPVNDSTQWKTLDDRTLSTLDNTMMAVGATHNIRLSTHTFLNSSLSATYGEIYFDNNYINSSYQAIPQQNISHRNRRLSASTMVNHKFGAKHTNRSGIVFTELLYDLNVSALNPNTGEFSVYNQGSGNTSLLQAFSESKVALSNTLTMNAGLHFQYFFLNTKYSVEPRISMKWQFHCRQSLSVGYGLHSQVEDIGVYMSRAVTGEGAICYPNHNLGFTRSNHFVLGYDILLLNDTRFKTEVYYQYLYDVPVMPGNYFSMINSNGWYSNDTLLNQGKGTNAGIDFTLEKFLTRQFYYLITVSLFESKYKGGDNIQRNARFNSNFVINALGGKEWTIRKKNILGVNLKMSYTGGEYYVPVDLQESVRQHREVLNDAAAYSVKLPGFFYTDFTVTYRTNHKKYSGIWAVQIKNVLDLRPVTGYRYNDFTKSVEEIKSSGMIPFISYKVEF